MIKVNQTQILHQFKQTLKDTKPRKNPKLILGFSDQEK